MIYFFNKSFSINNDSTELSFYNHLNFFKIFLYNVV